MARLNSQFSPLNLLVFALLVVAGDVWADDALLWLERMSKAMREKNYSGTFIYMHDDQVETMQIEHRNTSQGVSERLFSLNGEPREIVRNNSVVTCIFPDSKSVIIDKEEPKSKLPTNLPTNLVALDKHYKISILGEERVTGRNSKVIGIEPYDQYRYGYRLWIDTESDLMVRSAILDERNETVEQVLFTSLNLDTQVPDEGIQSKYLAEDFNLKSEIKPPPEHMVGVLRWKAKRLPPGFNLSAHKMRTKHKGVVNQLIYSDGMASVSVFIEAYDENKKRLKGNSHMGAVHVYGTVVNEHHVTVVGEVPPGTVKLIGQSVVVDE